jgi:ferric iron reductase protein FhuF
VSHPATLTPVAASDIEAAIRRAGERNPLLGTETGGSGQPSVRLTGPDGAAAAGELVDAVAGWLGIAERRVAGSLVVLGYAARLVGPAVAVLLRDGILLDLRPERTRYDFRPGRGFRLTLIEAAGWHGPHATLVDAVAAQLTEHLAPVLAAVREAAPVAQGLLWGNVASGIAGALRSVVRDQAADPRDCLALGEALLGHGPLAGSGDFTPLGADLRFVRHSCCLYYRLDGAGTCGDCPLPPTIALSR